MKALITGASSGIGREMAKLLAKKGYSLVLAARRKELLEALSGELNVPCKIEVTDLSKEEDCLRLFENNRDIDILINNAGFGVFGEFCGTDFDREQQMLRVNINAVHILMKKYLAEFKQKHRGKILNVASSASFFAGPMFSSYYASKAYVLRLSLAVREELRREKIPVTVSVLCPGPVRTEFNDVAGVSFGVGSVSAEYAAKIGIDGMMKGKKVIVPGFSIKCTRVMAKLLPDCVTSPIVYKLQKKKEK